MADDKPAENTQGNDKPAEDAQPEEAQVKGKLLTDIEGTDWGNEVQLVEKDAKTEANVLKEEVKEEEKPEEKAEVEPVKVEEEEDEQPIEIEAPGEFQPSDYSFDVVVYDEEGKKPKTIKVKSVDEWDELLEGEPNLGSSGAVSKAFRAAQRMELGLEKEREIWEQQVQEYEAAVESENLRIERNNTIFNEMQYLINKGELPNLTNEEMNSLNWKDEAVVKAHPNIAQHKELLNYMLSENKSRAKAGLAPLSSVIDAYNAMQLDSKIKAEKESQKKTAAARKEAGARVSSGTPGPVSAQSPRGIAVGRVGDLGRLGQNWSTGS